jgi:hypothetical protein
MNLMNVEGGSQMVTLQKKQFDAMTRKTRDWTEYNRKRFKRN